SGTDIHDLAAHAEILEHALEQAGILLEGVLGYHWARMTTRLGKEDQWRQLVVETVEQLRLCLLCEPLACFLGGSRVGDALARWRSLKLNLLDREALGVLLLSLIVIRHRQFWFNSGLWTKPSS